MGEMMRVNERGRIKRTDKAKKWRECALTICVDWDRMPWRLRV